MISYQNCGKSSSSTQGSAAVNNKEFVLPSAANVCEIEQNFVSDCATNGDFNACIFWKNPVAQNGAAITPAVTRNSDLSSLQIQAVNLTGFNTSNGCLENSSFDFKAYDGSGDLEDVCVSDQKFKFDYQGDTSGRVGSVMGFHCLNHQKNCMEESTGSFFAGNQNIDVHTNADFENATWDFVNRRMEMGRTSQGNEFALSCEVFAHEMGHANASYASNFKINEIASADNIQNCGTASLCCVDEKGCSWAIYEGLADYHGGLLYPDNTHFLETYVNDPLGVRECGLPRSMDLNNFLTAEQSYEACNTLKGEIHLMGRVYASVWWEVRKAILEEDSTKVSEVDALFSEHLTTLTGDDDFESALAKIKATDQAFFEGRYSARFEAEFARRGI